MKDVIISIEGVHATGGDFPEDADRFEFITSGEYTHKEQETVFSYMESKMTGMEGTRTTFRVNPHMVTLTREGTMNTQMVFEPGRGHIFLYETPYGSTSMGVNTRRLHCGLDDSGGQMEIDYTIAIDSVVVSKNSFVIRVREPGGGNRSPGA